MTTEEKIEEALSLLITTGLNFMLMVQSENGPVSYFSNSKEDRLFVVGQEEK